VFTDVEERLCVIAHGLSLEGLQLVPTDEHRDTCEGLVQRGWLKRMPTNEQGDTPYSWSRQAEQASALRVPLCAECGKVADVVHHRIPLTEGRPARDPEFLVSMCRACHSALHRRSAYTAL
jgi:HNH endonuclease